MLKYLVRSFIRIGGKPSYSVFSLEATYIKDDMYINIEVNLFLVDGAGNNIGYLFKILGKI